MGMSPLIIHSSSSRIPGHRVPTADYTTYSQPPAAIRQEPAVMLLATIAPVRDARSVGHQTAALIDNLIRVRSEYHPRRSHSQDGRGGRDTAS